MKFDGFIPDNGIGSNPKEMRIPPLRYAARRYLMLALVVR